MRRGWALATSSLACRSVTRGEGGDVERSVVALRGLGGLVYPLRERGELVKALPASRRVWHVCGA